MVTRLTNSTPTVRLGSEDSCRFEVPVHTDRPILALGADSKSAICMLHGEVATLSGPFGNLTEPPAYRRFVHAIDRVRSDPITAPEIIAHDMHPAFESTRLAKATGIPTVAVQHHHAHIAAVMAEHGLSGPVIGVCCDGLGYGADGGAWGCEILECGYGGYIRQGTLDPFPLVGGDMAAVQGWRPAAALLRQAFGDDWLLHWAHLRSAWPRGRGGPADSELVIAQQLMARRFSVIDTSSLGRVFDGVSFLLGLSEGNSFEGEAAIALEKAASRADSEPYPYEIMIHSPVVQMSVSPMIRAIATEVGSGAAVAEISARFHETIAQVLTNAALMIADRTMIHHVVLSGGCFANKRLFSRMIDGLNQQRVEVSAPLRISCGDMGIPLGQAVVAAGMLETARRCPGARAANRRV